MNGQWSLPWMADLEVGKQAVIQIESPGKTPSTGTPADTQPNTPTPGTVAARPIKNNERPSITYCKKINSPCRKVEQADKRYSLKIDILELLEF